VELRAVSFGKVEPAGFTDKASVVFHRACLRELGKLGTSLSRPVLSIVYFALRKLGFVVGAEIAIAGVSGISLLSRSSRGADMIEPFLYGLLGVAYSFEELKSSRGWRRKVYVRPALLVFTIPAWYLHRVTIPIPFPFVVALSAEACARDLYQCEGFAADESA
jgi:hypothetical protein